MSSNSLQAIGRSLAAVLLVAAASVAVSSEPRPNAPTGAGLFADAGCARCHGIEGGGLTGPRLNGANILADGDFLIRQILVGSSGAMPGFRNRLADGEIAAIINFMRSVWGDYPAVPVERVTEIRAGILGR